MESPLLGLGTMEAASVLVGMVGWLIWVYRYIDRYYQSRESYTKKEEQEKKKKRKWLYKCLIAPPFLSQYARTSSPSRSSPAQPSPFIIPLLSRSAI